MKKLIYILTLFICCACGHTPQQSEKPVITVTLEPLRYFTEAIAGDCFEVVSMVPKGSSPESYDPTPQQLVNLSKSQAYLRIGYIGFEQAWMKKLEANYPIMKVYDTSILQTFQSHPGNDASCLFMMLGRISTQEWLLFA